MLNIFLKALIFLLFLSFSQFAYAATPQIVTQMQKKYDEIQSFEADIIQNLIHLESGAVEERKGKLSFGKPFYLHWQISDPNELIIINRDEVWNYLEEENIAYRYHPDIVKNSILDIITGQNALDKEFDIEEAEKAIIDGEEYIHLKIYPKEPTPQLVEADLYVDQDTKLIKQAKMIDFYGNANEVIFMNMNVNPAIDVKKFNFKPSSDTKIEDNYDSRNLERSLFN